ncbi:MAG: PfkB family carbohydrate kinase [Pseudomonadota bacterium]
MARVLCVGQAVVDYVFYVDQTPRQAVKYSAEKFEIVGGGPAANAAVAVQRLGGNAMLATRLGDDQTAQIILEDLRSEGVDCTLAKCFPGRRSSLSAVSVAANGDRMIINYFDEETPFEPDWLNGQAGLSFDVALADTRWPDGGEKVFSIARETGMPRVVDVDKPDQLHEGLLGQATHLAFSAEAAAGFARTEDLRAASAKIFDRFGAWCCVTDGANGVHVFSGAGYQHTPAFSVTPVDTLGAGDIWHGAFALAIAEGEDETQAVRFANGAAAIKVTRPGGRLGAPTRTELDAFLHEQA